MDKVYIIESPSDTDLLADRKEGYALSSALSLAEVPHEYFLVTSESTLTTALEQIKEDITEQKRLQTDFQPFIHISAHGDKDGFYLTSEDAVYWPFMVDYLYELNRILGYLRITPDRKVSAITLCMSSCEGLAAKSIFDPTKKSVAQAVIGTEKKISWGESMIAYISFYNATIVKSSQIPRSVKAMNDAICETDVFILITSPELDNTHTY